MRISLDSRKPSGTWCSFNEFVGVGDGTTVTFDTPFPAKLARSLHVMREYVIIAPDNKNRILDTDGKLLRDEDDGYSITNAGDDKPLTITFQRPPRLGQRISVSVLGRTPPDESPTTTGKAFKVLPMTDNLSKALDAKLPESLKKRKRDDYINLPAVQEMYREAFMQVVVDCHGFIGDDGQPLTCEGPQGEIVKKAILNALGSIVLGGFAIDRARAIQQERISGLATELSD